jgi:hypothetical protein
MSAYDENTHHHENISKLFDQQELCNASLRACRPLVAFMLVAAPVALLRVCPAAAQDGAPVVSPDRIEDVPSIKADADAFADLDNFAWRAFIALNWPSLTDPAHRGVPDLAKTLGDPGPRVWETSALCSTAQFQRLVLPKGCRPRGSLAS